MQGSKLWCLTERLFKISSADSHGELQIYSANPRAKKAVAWTLGRGLGLVPKP